MTEGGKVTGWRLAPVIFNGCNPVFETLRPPSDSRTRGIEGLQASFILAGGSPGFNCVNHTDESNHSGSVPASHCEILFCRPITHH
ncbi:hypothetical protein LEMLEM_LOCUS4525 [Lemmus lemmus]